MRGGTVPEIVEAILDLERSRRRPASIARRRPRAAPILSVTEAVFELLHLPGQTRAGRTLRRGHESDAPRARGALSERRGNAGGRGRLPGRFCAQGGARQPAQACAALGRRHKSEVALVVVGLHPLQRPRRAFIYRITVEKDRALASEQRALENERQHRGRASVSRRSGWRHCAARRRPFPRKRSHSSKTANSPSA